MLIVYGHSMNGGSMFAALQGYLDAQYRENHPVIRCDSLTGAREYEVMAVLRFSATIEANEAYYTVPENEEEFMEYTYRSFGIGLLGESCASSVILCVIVMVLTFIFNRYLTSKEVEA